ncbi:hypothetical protein SAMN05216588_115134 [Pseudomonas flavescens]|uniref:Uncharacterized protein n=1 Tax=Phytopseudomonas flavescens TaxID=29435 RepID=A0A1G8K343_9GAMM|nr:hypothetical protein [Pseudomonas flavescens]SDI37230.1 hypothetical protein SAMN05216588_115134 [Pseudomonas flavescens]
MDGLQFTSICKHNCLIIFDALSPGELQTGKHLYSNVQDHAFAIDRQGYCTRYEISSRSVLYARIMQVLQECKAGVSKPVLHFEGHGDAARGLYIAASSEYIAWADLQDLIAEVNEATRNNTGVVVAACHGFALAERLQCNTASPFNFLIAPDNEMSAGAFRDTMSGFYKIMAVSGDLASGLQVLPPTMQLRVAGEWFYRELAAYFIHHFTQADRQVIIEEAVTQVMLRYKAIDRNNRRILIKAARASVRKKLKFSDIARYFSQIFFHGSPPVTDADFTAFVDGAKTFHSARQALRRIR